jgi:hypothetical protein
VSLQCVDVQRSGLGEQHTRAHLVRLAALIAFAAAGLRLLLLWRQGGPFSDIEYDDGVHLASSLLLVHGHALYRDQVFLHPPGISLLLLPFASASAWLGQPLTFALTRVLTVGVSAVGTGLVAYIVARAGSSRRAVIAGAFAAVFAPSMTAGSTLMLEPWLVLFGLLAVERLTRAAPRQVDVAAAGAYLGLATGVKVWGLILLAGVGLWLFCEGRRHMVPPMLAAAGTMVLALTGPFLVLGGGRLLDDVIWTQLRRPPDGIQGTIERTAALLGLDAHLSERGHALVVAALLLLALLMVRAALTPGVARLGAIVLAIAIPVFANAPSFFFHYGDFFTPWLALLVAMQPGLGRPERLARVDLAGALAAILVVALLCQSVALLSRQQPADVKVGLLQALVGRHSCVVSDQASVLLLANAFDRPGCRSWLDPRGAALTELHGAEDGFYPGGFQRLPQWQHEYVALMSHADSLVLTGAPGRHPEWTQATRRCVLQHFHLVAAVGRAGPGRIPIEVWQRRR